MRSHNKIRQEVLAEIASGEDGSDEVKSNCDAVKNKNGTDGNNGGVAMTTNRTPVLLLLSLIIGFIF